MLSLGFSYLGFSYAQNFTNNNAMKQIQNILIQTEDPAIQIKGYFFGTLENLAFRTGPTTNVHLIVPYLFI